MAKQQVIISVLADTKKFHRDMKALGQATGLTRLKDAAAKAGKALAAATAAAGALAVAMGTKAVAAASDLEQSIGAINDVFKQNAATVHDFATEAANAVGLSRNSYNELATILGTQLKNGGTALDELAGKTNNLITLGADLAAGFGGSTVDAVNAISSALKGERDPIERYGVSLRQTTIDAKAAELGFTKLGGQFDENAQQAATLALIYEQTADFQGKFGAESDTLAHKQQVLGAKLENLAATLGEYLTPAVSAVVDWLTEHLEPALASLQQWIEDTVIPALQKFWNWLQVNVIPALQSLWNWLQVNVIPALQSFGQWIITAVIPALMQFGQWILNNASSLIGLAAAISGALAAYKAYQITMLTVRAAITAVAAAQALLNAVMAANPIAVVIALIGMLVGALVYLYNTNEQVRVGLQFAWRVLSTVVGTAIGFIVGFVRQLWETVTTMASIVWSVITGDFSGAWDKAKEYVKKAWDKIPGSVQDGIIKVGQFITELPGKIVGWLGDLGSLLWNAGKSLINGLIDGIKSVFGDVKDTLGDLTSKLTSWKGPPKKDARLLYGAGRLVIGGFINGLESQYRNVARSLGGLSADIPGMFSPATPSITGTRATYRPVTVNVNALNATAETGRMISRALTEYEHVSGRPR